jgi:hypothetical protein
MYSPLYYRQNQSMFKVVQLMQQTSLKFLKKLSTYVYEELKKKKKIKKMGQPY